MKKQTINTRKKPIISAQAPAAWLGACLLSVGLVWAPPTLASEVTCAGAPDIEAAGMYCFKPNTAAKSGQVNANFKHLLDENKALLQRIAALEAKLAAVSDSSTADYLLIEGANVQITNGAGSTTTANSKGNLIIGYNAAATRNVCSNGSGTTEADCENNGGIWDSNQRQGSHNVVIGDQHQYSQFGGLVAGLDNAVVSENSSVSGGYQNTASGFYASISGGLQNTTFSGYADSISGGYQNFVSGYAASVSGGEENTASGGYASVSGGKENTARGQSASVSGGWQNTASGQSASVSGGWQNNATALAASVSGGLQNAAIEQYASVIGGAANTASGEYASVSGGENNTAGNTASTVVGSQYLTTSADYETIP